MTRDKNRQFDENLRALGGRACIPDDASPDVKARCLETLGGAHLRHVGVAAFRRRAWWSTVGLAAMLALAAIPLFSNGMPNVKAAVVLTKLSEQIEQSDVFEVTIDQITVDDQVRVDGVIQISDAALAGDISALVREAVGEEPIEVDLSLGISADGGWILIRSIKIPDPEVQPFIDLLFPDGTETLLILPDEVIHEILEEELGGELAEVRAMASGQIVGFIKQVIDADEDLGVTIVEQGDGTLRLTLPIGDANALQNIIALVARNMGEDPGEIDISDEDISELLGATFSVVYDPGAEAVRSFSVSDLAEIQGTISVSLSSGPIDPALLDSDRVRGPNTRVLDITAFKSLIEGLADKFGD